MKTFAKRLLSFVLLPLMLFILMSLISCEAYLPVTGGTDPGGTSPGGTDPGGTNPSSSLASQLEWLKNNALTGSSHVIVVTSDETIAPQNNSFSARNITLTLKGDGANRTIILSSPGSMFKVSSGYTLILDNNITLRGISGNTRPLVSIEGGGTLIMNAGSAITSNGNYGVEVASDIAGNASSRFTMNGGTISGNGGRGVYVRRGSFTMSGGTISGNTVSIAGGGVGGGVRVGEGGSFTMSGGTISGNTASDRGGGVYGRINKTGGTITGYDSDQGNGNVVRDSSGAVQSYKGHAVYTSTKRKETTAGPGVNLSNNSNDGWDFY